MSTSDSRVAHALAYPFDPPAFGYAFRHDAAEPLRVAVADLAVHPTMDGGAPLVDIAVADEQDGNEIGYQRRVPVIAAGSNASFHRLKSKFAEKGLPGDFPVLRVAVRGLVPVYSAHISVYGSIPGTLTGEAGARTFLHIAFLNRVELERLNETESVGKNYALALIPLEGTDLAAGLTLPGVLAYVSKRGTYAPDGRPARVAAFESHGSRHAPLDQRGILQRLRAHVGAGEELETFIAAHIDDAALRAERTAAMARAARPCAIDGLRCVAGGLDAPPARLPSGFEQV